MSATFAACNHLHDDGHRCNSAAAKDQRYCLYHLGHRARLMRMAQSRARGERFDLKLPPLESMHAVLSGLSQLAEALAADMIDLKRADRLIRVLNSASRVLLRADKWPAAPVFHSDQAVDVDLVADYGLPPELNIDLAPEAAFPLHDNLQSVIPSGGGAPSALPESKDPFVSAYPSAANSGLSPMPTVAYCKHGPGCPEHTIRADYPVTPEMVEIVDVSQTQGSDAAAHRGKQLDRNWQRRQLHANRKRYAAVAMEKNLRLAADRMAERKLAEQAQASGSPAPPPNELTLAEEFDALNAREAAAKKPPTSAPAGCPTPASFAGVGVSSAKKPPASAVEAGEPFATKEAITA